MAYLFISMQHIDKHLNIIVHKADGVILRVLKLKFSSSRPLRTGNCCYIVSEIIWKVHHVYLTMWYLLLQVNLDENWIFTSTFSFRTMLCKFCVLAVVALSLLSLTLGQVSFSTNWGSGKRSSSSFIAPQADDACWTKSNAKLLYDLMQVIQVKKNYCLHNFHDSRFYYSYKLNSRETI